MSFPGHHCLWFQNTMANAGQKGFSVVASRDGEYRKWRLVAIPFEEDDVPVVSRALAQESSTSGIAIAMMMPLRYCPGCGADLRALIEQHRDAFDRLADETRQRFPAWW